MTDKTPSPRIIHIDELHPGLRERAFGDGLTADERFRQDISHWTPPEQIDRLVASMLSDMERQVASGAMVQIVGPRGVMGWHPSDTGPFAAAAPAHAAFGVGAAEAKRTRKRAKAASRAK